MLAFTIVCIEIHYKLLCWNPYCRKSSWQVSALHDPFMSLRPIPSGWLLHYKVWLPAQGTFLCINTWRCSFNTIIQILFLSFINFVFMTSIIIQKSFLTQNILKTCCYHFGWFIPCGPFNKIMLRSHGTHPLQPSKGGCQSPDYLHPDEGQWIRWCHVTWVPLRLSVYRFLTINPLCYEF